MKRIDGLFLSLAFASLSWLAACSHSDDSFGRGGAVAPRFTVLPVLTQNPNPRAPLVANITAETDELTTIRLILDDGQEITTLQPNPGFSLFHDLLVLGLKTNRTYTITVEATDVEGNVTTVPTAVVITTPAPPEPFFPFEVTVSNPSQMEPGVTLFAPGWSGGPDDFEPDPDCVGLLVMIDQAGEVVWYYCAPHDISDVRQLANGNFLYITGRQGVVEIDILGDIQRSWVATRLLADDGAGGFVLPEGFPEDAVRVDTDTMHHEVIALPFGAGADFATLSSELRELPNYPNSVVNPGSTDPIGRVVGDVIVEFNADGTVVREISLFDVIDPYRVSYDSLGSFWNNFYPGGLTRDWTHANAVIYDASDASYVVSVRHQDALIKVTRETGTLAWILGDHARWDPPWSAFLLAPVVTELFALPPLGAFACRGARRAGTPKHRTGSAPAGPTGARGTRGRSARQALLSTIPASIPPPSRGAPTRYETNRNLHTDHDEFVAVGSRPRSNSEDEARPRAWPALQGRARPRAPGAGIARARSKALMLDGPEGVE